MDWSWGSVELRDSDNDDNDDEDDNVDDGDNSEYTSVVAVTMTMAILVAGTVVQ